MTARAVVLFSGGAGSWLAAERAVARFGAPHVVALMADTRSESPDTYAFAEAAAAHAGLPLTMVADGRTVWEVFRDVRFLGNATVCPASRILKSDVCDAWLAEHATPGETLIVPGYDWSELHRVERLRARYAPLGYDIWAPMCEPPYLDKRAMVDAIRAAGLPMPDAYAKNFAHNNCGKKCVRAGVGHWAHVHRDDPAAYREAEREEEALRAELGDVAILRDRRGGRTRPLPLRVLRERLEAGAGVDLFDIGGCGCFADEPSTPEEARHEEEGRQEEEGHVTPARAVLPTGRAA